MHFFLFLATLAPLSVAATEAGQCACAKDNVNLRTGPGTWNSIVTTLTSRHCLPFSGQSQVRGSYTWLRLVYNGQSVWAASNWLTVKVCTTTDQETKSGVQLPGCPRIVTRAQWDARAPSGPIGTMPQLPIYVFIHHGASDPCSNQDSCMQRVRAYQNYHMDHHGWYDIGYNFLVGEDGNAYEARGWTEIGAHTKGYNTNGIAICVIGDFSTRLPSQAALVTVQNLITCGLNNGRINASYTLKGHRDVARTTCPGESLYRLIGTWSHFASKLHLYSV